MKKGGYQILDFENNTFSLSGAVPMGTIEVKDIYEKIKGTLKTFLISGISFKDTSNNVPKTEFRDVYSTPYIDGTSFVFPDFISVKYSAALGVGKFTLTVNNDDTVKLSVKFNSGK